MDPDAKQIEHHIIVQYNAPSPQKKKKKIYIPNKKGGLKTADMLGRHSIHETKCFDH